MSRKLPATPNPEIDKESFVDWKKIAVNQEKIKICYDNQIKKLKLFNTISIICASILLTIVIGICVHYRRETTSSVDISVPVNEDGLVYFVAKVKRTEIGPSYLGNMKSGNNCTMYIIDYDKHIFSVDFDPELLLLEDGSYIKVYYETKYAKEVHIKLSDYEIYGNLEEQYYLNMEVNGNE